MSSSIINIENVNKWFGDFQVLKDIIKVKDNPPQAPVSTQFRPSNLPSSTYSSKNIKYFNVI